MDKKSTGPYSTMSVLLRSEAQKIIDLTALVAGLQQL